ncbi:hypothetical protein OF83DRAFT_1088948 [Amylostereum chailletii]|nr:hypothetical protein OF83DRAFT_1088948 [Amylostereum chailletii]
MDCKSKRAKSRPMKDHYFTDYHQLSFSPNISRLFPVLQCGHQKCFPRVATYPSLSGSKERGNAFRGDSIRRTCERIHPGEDSLFYYRAFKDVPRLVARGRQKGKGGKTCERAADDPFVVDLDTLRAAAQELFPVFMQQNILDAAAEALGIEADSAMSHPANPFPPGENLANEIASTPPNASDMPQSIHSPSSLRPSPVPFPLPYPLPPSVACRPEQHVSPTATPIPTLVFPSLHASASTHRSLQPANDSVEYESMLGKRKLVEDLLEDTENSALSEPPIEMEQWPFKRRRTASYEFAFLRQNVAVEETAEPPDHDFSLDAFFLPQYESPRALSEASLSTSTEELWSEPIDGAGSLDMLGDELFPGKTIDDPV